MADEKKTLTEKHAERDKERAARSNPLRDDAGWHEGQFDKANPLRKTRKKEDER